jgi:hypothetical protein
MRLSRAKKLKVYFDPDARSYKSNNNDNGELLRDQKTGSVYKLHLINLDRQKDQIFDIAINTNGN